MIRCTIELLPYGDEEKKRSLGVIEIINEKTGDQCTGNYKVNLQKISEYGESLSISKSGTVSGFKRLESDVFYLLAHALKGCGYEV